MGEVESKALFYYWYPYEQKGQGHEEPRHGSGKNGPDSNKQNLQVDKASVMSDATSDSAGSSSSRSTSPAPSASSVTSTTTVPSVGDIKPREQITDEDRAKAAAVKADANKAFQAADYLKAAELYTEASSHNPYDATLFCNRAYARMKLEENGYAIEDATRAIELDPKYVKAYYRRALCQLSVLRPQLAIPDFKTCLSLEPANKLAKTQLDATTKLLRRIQFEAAIAVGDEKPAAIRCREIIEEGGCDHLDKTYAGPKLPIVAEAAAGKRQPTYGISKEFVEEMLEWFKSGKQLPKRFVWEIVLGCNDVLKKEASLVEMPVREGMTCDIIGDTHGQFYDLLNLLSMTGPPSDTHCLLFNGDFVDRGSWSLEVILTLMAYKWLYPQSVGLNRGNHEAKDMNKVYGFEGEVKHKHGEQTYNLFADVFTSLPLSTMVSPSLPPKTTTTWGRPSILSPEGLKRYFVVHGGLFSRDGVTLDEIRSIDRFGRQPGQEGLMCELLWTDPQELPGRGPSKRGVGIAFGPDVTRSWCELNGVTGIYRSHEVRQGGYAVEHDGLCTTVFSAPNYVDQGNNLGAYVRIDANGEVDYHTFKAVPHPPMKPMAYASPALGMFG